VSLAERQDWRIIALDANRLLKSFQIDTQWVVVTGAPSSGKTTLLQGIPLTV